MRTVHPLTADERRAQFALYFDRFADRAARRDAEDLTPTQLMESLAANLDHPWSPPGGGPLGALSHEVIHGLDVALALDRVDEVSTERVAAVLEAIRPAHLRSFGTTVDGVRLVATDSGFVRDGALVGPGVGTLRRG